MSWEQKYNELFGFMKTYIKHLHKREDELRKINNLSRYAWEQVERKPEEAKELFKKIYTISSDEDTSKWYNCAHCDAGYPDQECTCEEQENGYRKQEHPPECKWHKDWHSCNCGLFDNKESEE